MTACYNCFLFRKKNVSKEEVGTKARCAVTNTKTNTKTDTKTDTKTIRIYLLARPTLRRCAQPEMESTG